MSTFSLRPSSCALCVPWVMWSTADQSISALSVALGRMAASALFSESLSFVACMTSEGCPGNSFNAIQIFNINILNVLVIVAVVTFAGALGTRISVSTVAAAGIGVPAGHL
mgnify:CR=1 FL=1